MASAKKTCVKCGEEFELLPGKPGLATHCPACSPSKPLDPAAAREAHREKIRPLMKAASRQNKDQEEARHGEKWSRKYSGLQARYGEREKIFNKLRQVGVAVANGMVVSEACKEAGITEQTYQRWCKEYCTFS